MKDSHTNMCRENTAVKINACTARRRPRLGVEHHAEPAEVQLALHPRIAVGHPHRGLPAAEPAPLCGEPVQRPIRHHHTAAGELAVDVGQLQLVLR